MLLTLLCIFLTISSPSPFLTPVWYHQTKFSPHLSLRFSLPTHTSPGLSLLSRYSRTREVPEPPPRALSSWWKVDLTVVFSSVFLAPRVLYKAPHFISDPRPPKRSQRPNEEREVLDSGDDVWSGTRASPEGTKGEEEKRKSTPQWVAMTRSVRGVRMVWKLSLIGKGHFQLLESKLAIVLLIGMDRDNSAEASKTSLFHTSIAKLTSSSLRIQLLQLFLASMPHSGPAVKVSWVSLPWN